MTVPSNPAAGKFNTILSQGWGVAFVCVFSYATAHFLFHLRESYWAPIAAAVVLYPDSQATRKASTDRFLGTAIGCLVGWGTANWWQHNVFLYGVAIFVGVGICWLLRLQSAARLCAVAISVIVLIPRDEPASHVALYRFLEVSYGVACALVYSLAIEYCARSWNMRRQKSRPRA
jgi:uncharacterized membrane protein YgaE (UPF0421/DUF939 family)